MPVASTSAVCHMTLFAEEFSSCYDRLLTTETKNTGNCEIGPPQRIDHKDSFPCYCSKTMQHCIDSANKYFFFTWQQFKSSDTKQSTRSMLMLKKALLKMSGCCDCSLLNGPPIKTKKSTGSHTLREKNRQNVKFLFSFTVGNNTK